MTPPDHAKVAENGGCYISATGPVLVLVVLLLLLHAWGKGACA